MQVRAKAREATGARSRWLIMAASFFTQKAVAERGRLAREDRKPGGPATDGREACPVQDDSIVLDIGNSVEYDDDGDQQDFHPPARRLPFWALPDRRGGGLRSRNAFIPWEKTP